VTFLNDKALNIKIPQELYNKLKKEAEKKNISLASLVRMLCSEYFEKQSK
jgi:predicted HicB family RNase H-like nuclease